MTVYQHVVEVDEFARFLGELAARLDPGSGWYGVFLRRDPGGMRACFDGVEVPPWDVVESLLQDLAAACGTQFAEQESVRAASLYSASAAARDRLPGGRQELYHRLELMIGEQEEAARRLRAAGSGGARNADRQALAWAQDDHRRASARCDEIRTRLTAIAAPSGWFRAEGDGYEEGPVTAVREQRAPNVRTEQAGSSPTVPAPRDSAGPAPKPVRRKPRGARFAGLEVDEDGAGPAPSALPLLPSAAPSAPKPRGARFGGAARAADADPEVPAPVPAADPETVRAAADVVALLLAMRAEGRTGEAYAVLCEAAAWPAERLPVLAVALGLAGLGADWTTLLWEVSSLPAAGLAAAVGALAEAGRDEDCGRLLRQGASRSAEEVADAAVALDLAGRDAEAGQLLGAFVRVRSPQDAARVAGASPARLVPQLLAAARTVSAAREWDLVHALRVAGLAGA
ncbi:hypothetical protein [Streptomyces sp. NBC_00102]|uniref:hypothetical protein n=1 Tax=Streptomyces sp. NBC_00102 TaxID=2975652 RepID=UPI00225BC7F6|nr:hypothetical protein [Streptomyces sp. NBC_00102]MCX5400775.1 hypothetical protein [Streptomyces sp. NBC_00102]